MRHPATAAFLVAGLLAAPAFAQAPQATPPGPPPAAGAMASDPGLDALHARKEALMDRMDVRIKNRTLDAKYADHIKFEVNRMNTDEAAWRRRQVGKVYPNQLASLNKRLDEIEAYAAKGPPAKK